MVDLPRPTVPPAPAAFSALETLVDRLRVPVVGALVGMGVAVGLEAMNDVPIFSGAGVFLDAVAMTVGTVLSKPMYRAFLTQRPVGRRYSEARAGLLDALERNETGVNSSFDRVTSTLPKIYKAAMYADFMYATLVSGNKEGYQRAEHWITRDYKQFLARKALQHALEHRPIEETVERREFYRVAGAETKWHLRLGQQYEEQNETRLALREYVAAKYARGIKEVGYRIITTRVPKFIAADALEEVEGEYRNIKYTAGLRQIASIYQERNDLANHLRVLSLILPEPKPTSS